MTRLIEYFSTNHLIANLFVVLVLVAGIFSWYDIRKEELPDFAWDSVSISTAYPGAAPMEVEQALTLPLEHELADLEFVRRMESKSRRGASQITLELERGKDSELAVTEIQNRVLSAKLPGDLEQPPNIRQFKSSQKAIIDIALYFEGQKLLSTKERRKLQQHMRDLENQLLRRNELSLMQRDAYLEEEIHIMPRVEDLFQYQITLREMRDGIRSHHTQMPLGIMETPDREQVRLDGRLEHPKDFFDIPLRSSFLGNSITVADIASVDYAFADTTSLVRINGHEAVVFNVVKSTRVGILEAVDVVKEELNQFLKAHNKTGLKATLLDDESYGVRNRLSIIAGNAVIGFALILVMLSLFLNGKTAFWVSAGIPFSIFIALILANLFDYTVNNMSLAGIILAMGMLVDDAIVVSENISRLRMQGYNALEAAVAGTREVVAPITASILTTIAAFLPLLTFEGRLALLTTTIPPMVCFVLLGSLIESVVILPGHLSLHFPKWMRLPILKLPIRGRRPQSPEEIIRSVAPPKQAGEIGEGQGDWFIRLEERFAIFLERLLHYRLLIFTFFLALMGSGIFLFLQFMNFSLFPREQVSTAFIIAEAPAHFDRYQTLKLAEPFEDFLVPRVGQEFIGIRTLVGYRRYRPSDEENMVSIRIEMNEDNLSGEQTIALVEEIRAKMDQVKGFKKMRLSTQTFGSDSGSAVELLIQEDDNQIRNAVADTIADELKKVADVGYVEVDRPASEYEYQIKPKRKLMDQLGVNPSEVENTFRSALSGLNLYSFYANNEEVFVRLRFPQQTRSDIKNILQIPATNNTGFQVPLNILVDAKREKSLSEIQRVDQRRVLRINADIKAGVTTTALEIAGKMERDIFPKVRAQYPSASFVFDGEVKNTRESSSFFQTAAIAVFILIFSILAIQFNSLFKPIVIMIAIVPTWTALTFVFLAHGIDVYGFFAVVGALGLSGIVVNGAILLIDRIKRDVHPDTPRAELLGEIARAAARRLRAVMLTTITTVAGLLPTAYGVAGYDSMLAEMMLTLSWGLIFAMSVTLVLVPAVISLEYQWKSRG